MEPTLQQMQADLAAYRAKKQPTQQTNTGDIQADLAAFRASGGQAPNMSTPNGPVYAPPPAEAPKPERNLLQKVGDFLAPTATKSVEKLAAGEGLGLRDVAGSALEIGSFAIPAGAVARVGGIGLKGLKALSLAKKAGLGAATGAISGAAQEAGRATGEEGTTIGDIASRAAGGVALGGAAGGLLPLGGALAMGTARKIVPAASIAARGAKNLTTATARGLGGKLAEEAQILKLPETQRTLRRAGFDERSTAFLTKAKPETKKGFKQMVDIAEKGAVNPRFRVQPKQVLGQSFLKRVDDIQRDSKRATRDIVSVAKQPKKVDISGAIDAFNKQLESRGISLEISYSPSGNPVAKYVSRGNLPSSETKYYRDILKEIELVTRGKNVISNSQAHQLRQRLFATLESEARKGTQPGVRPFSDKVDQDVNLLRGKIAEALGTKYKTAAKRFAENEKTLRDVAKFAGVPNDWEKISSKDLKFGEILFRTLGNASDKPLTLLNDVEKLAKARGGKYGDDILDLADFADSLEDLYGISKTRGFEGGIARGTQQGTGGDSIPTGLTDIALRALQAATRTGNQDKIDALKKLLGI